MTNMADRWGRKPVRNYRLDQAMEGLREQSFESKAPAWDVDTGKGFTQIYHAVIEQLAHAKLNGPDYAIILVVIRKTIGWRKYRDGISLSQFMQYTGLDKRTVQSALKRLRRINVLLKLSEPTPRKAANWALNRKTRSWPVRKAKPERKSAASERYINAARNGGKSVPQRVRIVPRTRDKEQHITIRIKKGNPEVTATAPKLKLKLIGSPR